ncbi:DUF1684 domain-containing protein [Hymenobacter sp. 5516J-16]|uniref:DUF1684 domain-containing protein n=1 Tax=Hymenobacter sp. 5516J-16 TaxID=2932253 RepID=UPI001FD1211A|nr:DUF1684 domain-containing protein [Hymenobacter sp. 5516J-16]UOQ76016.1 DUF1684 domain-containing protein [Hymenobacter sp. 5516J-16]
MRINPKLFIGLGLLLVLGYSLQDLVLGDNQYVAGVAKARKEKNDSFRRATDSPLSAEQRNEFDSLRYFAPDKTYRVSAQVERFAKPETVQIPLTDGKADTYLRWGRASFELADAPQQLVLLLRPDEKDGKLFVAFADKTNGFTTYGGGRYLDVDLPAEGDDELTLDFNQAYNPFCAYGTAYACPVPPQENRLAVEVRAGEMAFPETDHTGHNH